MKNMSLRDRFEQKFARIPFAGCWLWTGAGGRYGSFMLNGRRRDAHRAAWELYCGAIPAGTCVLHKCDVPMCVNPGHLFLGSHRDNTLDMINKGRHGGIRRKDRRTA
jgi:hypothetical protein